MLGQNKIDLKVLKLPGSINERNNSRLRSNISISKIFKNVNSKDLLRYIPDDMINAEQRKIKYEGIAETIKYTNDKNDRKYAEYIAKVTSIQIKLPNSNFLFKIVLFR